MGSNKTAEGKMSRAIVIVGFIAAALLGLISWAVWSLMQWIGFV